MFLWSSKRWIMISLFRSMRTRASFFNTFTATRRFCCLSTFTRTKNTFAETPCRGTISAIHQSVARNRYWAHIHDISENTHQKSQQESENSDHLAKGPFVVARNVEVVREVLDNVAGREVGVHDRRGLRGIGHESFVQLLVRCGERNFAPEVLQQLKTLLNEQRSRCKIGNPRSPIQRKSSWCCKRDISFLERQCQMVISDISVCVLHFSFQCRPCEKRNRNSDNFSFYIFDVAVKILSKLRNDRRPAISSGLAQQPYSHVTQCRGGKSCKVNHLQITTHRHNDHDLKSLWSCAVGSDPCNRVLLWKERMSASIGTSHRKSSAPLERIRWGKSSRAISAACSITLWFLRQVREPTWWSGRASAGLAGEMDCLQGYRSGHRASWNTEIARNV